MKIFILTLCIIGLICSPSESSIRNIQDNHEVDYFVIDSSGNHVTGETVALKIKKTSNGYWFDFNDSTFKNADWVAKSANLSEDSTEGYYYYTYNPPASETTSEQYLFVVNNDSIVYGDHQSEMVAYQNIGTSTLVASDNIGINWADVDAPTTTLNLSGTTISTNQAIASVSGAVGSVSGGVTVTTNNDKAGYSISGAKTTLDALNDIAAADVWLAGTRTLTSGGYSGLTATDVDAIWDELISGHLTAGTTGKKLNEMPTPYFIGP